MGGFLGFSWKSRVRWENKREAFIRNLRVERKSKVSVKVAIFVAILQHYARRLIFMKQIYFSLLIFKKKMQNTLTLLIIFVVKSLQIELHSTNLLLWSPTAGIKVQSTQSATTPRRLTLGKSHGLRSQMLVGLEPTVSDPRSNCYPLTKYLSYMALTKTIAKKLKKNLQ